MTTTLEMMLEANCVKWEAQRMAHKVRPLIEQQNGLADLANALQGQLRALYSEVSALESEINEMEDLTRAGAGLTTGMENSVMQSMRSIVNMKPESLSLTIGKRWLLVGAMSMGARRAMRKAVVSLPQGNQTRPSMHRDCPFMSQNIGIAIAMAKGYGVQEAYGMWESDQITSIDKALSLKPAGVPEQVGWKDLGFADTDSATQFAQVGDFALTEDLVKGLR